jgi:hypothetical protein
MLSSSRVFADSAKATNASIREEIINPILDFFFFE